MNDILCDMPSDIRAKLIAALESGYLNLTVNAIGLRAALGRIENANAIAEALHELHDLGTCARGAAPRRLVAHVAAQQRKPDLVLSGLQMPGIFARYPHGLRRTAELGCAQRLAKQLCLPQ